MKSPFANAPVISSYTSDEAEEDGILFDIVKVNPAWAKGWFKYVTTNLMNEGYFEKDGKVRIPNFLDLLNQANQIVKKGHAKNKTDTFFSGDIELPSGKKQKIFIGLNELNKFTIMLPSDY